MKKFTVDVCVGTKYCLCHIRVLGLFMSRCITGQRHWLGVRTPCPRRRWVTCVNALSLRSSINTAFAKLPDNLVL